MTDTPAQRRMAENEVIFREHNESIQKAFDEVKRIAAEDGQVPQFEPDDTPLHFYCECSDENCKQRVSLQPSRYNEIHKKRNMFVIICGHEVKGI